MEREGTPALADEFKKTTKASSEPNKQGKTNKQTKAPERNWEFN